MKLSTLMIGAAWAVVSASLGGCALVKSQTVTQEKLANVKSIGIISALGDEVQFRDAKVSKLLFGGSISVEPAGWDVDSHVIQHVAEQVSGSFQVVPVTYDKQAFAPKKLALIATNPPDVKGAVRALPPNPALDAYLVITKLVRENPYHLPVEMLGVERGDVWEQVYARFEIYLVDARTGDWIGFHHSELDCADIQPKSVDRTPTRVRAKWLGDLAYKYPSLASEYTPAQKAELKAELMGLLDRGLNHTLEQMYLRPRRGTCYD